MKANISRIYSEVPISKDIVQCKLIYRVDWLNDDGTVNEGHDKDTLAECLDWCRQQKIGWWRAVGFSEEFIKVGEAE